MSGVFRERLTGRPSQKLAARPIRQIRNSIPSKRQFEGALIKPEELAAKLPTKKTNGHASPDHEPGEPFSRLGRWSSCGVELAAIPV